MRSIPYPVFRIHHRWTPILADVGDRKCAFDGCNALEFRTSGYCLRHKEEASMGGTGKGDVAPESVILFPGTMERQQKWKVDSGFFAGLILPSLPIFLGVLLISSMAVYPDDSCCLVCFSPPIVSALIINNADKNGKLSMEKGAKFAFWIWSGLSILVFLALSSLF